jgi:outer membrane protein OmpA-like peptidoglycan-associated protein
VNWRFPRAPLRVRDHFNDEWTLEFLDVVRSFEDESTLREQRRRLEDLVFQGFGHSGATDDEIASVLLQAYDELTGERLAQELQRPSDDPDQLLRRFDERLRDTLTLALASGAMRIEPVARRPWPFLGQPDTPVPKHLDVPAPEPPADAHFIELQVLTTKGADAANVACQVTLADGTILQGTTGPDGILRFDDLDIVGTATIVLPDVVPFSPADALRPPSNSGALRIVRDGVSAPIDARTVIEIPPQVYRGRLIGMFFDKNKAFLLPQAMHGIKGLASYFERHPDAQLLVVGHTDATGSDDYNVKLSVERAKAVAAYLKDDVDAWAAWFGDDKPDEKRWGTLELQRMLSALPDGQDDKFYSVDPPTGRKDAATRDAVSSFQAWSNQTKGTSLSVDGDAGHATRPEIVRAYMALEGTSVPESTVVKTHGCGPFHPQDPTPQGVADPDNRRVEVFVFDDAIDPAPQTCASPGCSQYGEWVDRVVQTVDFGTADLDPTPLVVGRLPTLFSVGKSFPKPSALPMLRDVVRRMNADVNTHVLILGHTDRSDDDGVDGALSKARADAIAALLLGDRGAFLTKFSSGGDADAWGWEEMQWMLSAVTVQGEPCYVGVIDGHRGDATIEALETFQLFNGIPMNRRADDVTLRKLVDEYLQLFTDVPLTGDRIMTSGGGCWHPPRSFGDDSKPLEGDDYEDNHFRSFRRVELFLNRTLLTPPADACPAGRHEVCAAYEAWCRDSKEELPDDGLHDFAIRAEDSLSRPVASASLTITGTDDTGRPSSISATTSATGIARLQVPRGLYCASFNTGGTQAAASFLLDQDEIGGLTIRLDGLLPDSSTDGAPAPSPPASSPPTSTPPTSAAPPSTPTEPD